MSCSSLHTKTRTDPAEAGHPRLLQARDAEIGRLLATCAQLEGAIAVLEAQNEALRRRLAKHASDANTQALLGAGGGRRRVVEEALSERPLSRNTAT